MALWTIWCSAMTLAVGLAAEGPLAHHVEGPLALGDGPHAVVDPPASEAPLGQHLGPVLGTEEVVEGDPDLVVADVVVVPGVVHDLDPRGVPRHHEHAVGAHDDEDVGMAARHW